MSHFTMIVALIVLYPVLGGMGLYWFAIASLVVLLSVLVHGSVIAVLLPSEGTHVEDSSRGEVAPPAREEPLRITIDEVGALQAAGETVIVVDARKERSYREDPRLLLGAVRVNPAARDARALRLPRNTTLAIYCS